MRFRWFFALAVAGAAAPASAATYYVSPGGNDSVQASSISAPFRTLQRAVSVLRSGDSIVLGEGVYQGGATISGVDNVSIQAEGQAVMDGSGAGSDDGLRIIGSRGVTVTNTIFRNWRRAGFFASQAHGLTIRDCTSTSNGRQGFLTVNTSDVTIQNCQATNNGAEHGIYLSQSGDRLKVINCVMTGNGRTGLQINAEETNRSSDPNFDQISRDCVISGNVMANNGSAINLMMVQNSVFENNLMYGNGRGVTCWDEEFGATYGTKNNKFIHNTIIQNSGFAIWFSSSSTGNQLYDNILVSNGGNAIDNDEAVQSDYNLLKGSPATSRGNLSSWQSATGNDRHSFEGDPRLGSDYRPAAGSPAIDMGTEMVDTDKDGRARPQGPNPDCGCYEVGNSTPQPPAVPRGLTATGGDSQVALSWSANSPTGLAGYLLYRSTSQTGGFTALNGQPITGTSFTDTSLTNGATYWYKIAAVATGGATSAQSAAVSATPGGVSGGGSGLIFEDALKPGWRLGRSMGASAFYAMNPAQGRRSVGVTFIRQNSYVLFSGTAVSLVGTTSLKLMVHGGTAGGQVLAVSLLGSGGTIQALSLSDYGGAPVANEWKEYTIPLADFGITGSLRGIKISTTARNAARAYLDNIEVE